MKAMTHHINTHLDKRKLLARSPNIPAVHRPAGYRLSSSLSLPLLPCGAAAAWLASQHIDIKSTPSLYYLAAPFTKMRHTHTSLKNPSLFATYYRIYYLYYVLLHTITQYYSILLVLPAITHYYHRGVHVITRVDTPLVWGN